MAPTPDDRSDLERARQGDRDALGRLLARQEPGLRARVSHRLTGVLRERSRTSDLLQSGYLQVVRKLATFRGNTEGEFGAWVLRILENRIRERQRFHRTSKRAHREAALQPDEVERAAAQREAFRSEDVRILAQALDALPADYRAILELRLAEDLSHDEIAKRLERSAGAARMLLARARAALALELEKRGGSTVG